MLSARAVEVSFASALSVVTSGRASGDSSGSGRRGRDDDGRRPHSTPPDELSHMLTAQLMDYAPASMGGEGRSFNSLGGGALLQHSHTINVPSLRSSGGRDVVGSLDAAFEHTSLDAPVEPALRRFSSTSAASRGAGLWHAVVCAADCNLLQPAVRSGWQHTVMDCVLHAWQLAAIWLHDLGQSSHACLPAVCPCSCQRQCSGQLGQRHPRQSTAGQRDARQHAPGQHPHLSQRPLLSPFPARAGGVCCSAQQQPAL